jgi:hypothetical protein
MARYRFSIRGMMIVIVVLALAFTALRTPSRLWANAWFTLALGGVTIAIPAAVANVGDRRAFWIGFAVCGWVYFIFSLAPWVDKEASHQLFSTTLLDLASPYIINNQYMLVNYKNAFAPPEAPEAPTPWQVWNLPNFQAPGSWGMGYVRLHCPFLYLRIGHCAFCLLIAIAGGELARFLSVTKVDPRPGPASKPVADLPRVPPVEFLTPEERAAASRPPDPPAAG